MRIAIAGYGVVGRAHAALFQNFHEVVIIDPKHYDRKFDDTIDAVIVCVPTPKGLAGACNMIHVTEVLKDCPNVPILIKSTISLQGWSYITDRFDRKSAFSPEFLRSDNALEDLREQTVVMLGGKEVKFWTKIFKEVFPNCPHIIETDPKDLITIKYFRNAFLATKVAFFNQLYDYCEVSGLNFENIRQHVTADPRIGPSHSYVSDERGFGGECLPKDIAALYLSALYYGLDLNIINSVIKYNNKIRNENN
jgi:UDPglucose 6-dehydrogenase